MAQAELAPLRVPEEALWEQAQTKEGDPDSEAVQVFTGLLINSSLICVDTQLVQLQLNGYGCQSKILTA